MDLANRQKSEAAREFREHPHPKPLTSPKALSDLLQVDIFKAMKCEGHEMLLVKGQTHEKSYEHFVSTVCARCRHHFHFKSQTRYTRGSNSKHPFHMLIVHQEKKSDVLQHEHQGRYDNAKLWCHFVCADSECHYGIEISVMPPKVSNDEVDMLLDEGRVLQNLSAAKKEDPDRYSEVPDGYGFPNNNGAPWTLARYLADALSRPADEEPLRIKKRNKRFKVVFSTDFDVLLRTLGFEERDDETADGCWFIGTPEPKDASAPTAVKTLRARMEDAMAEIQAVIKTQTVPAWDSLVKVFEGSLGSFNRPTRLLSDPPPPESSLQLLGCLPDYDPIVYSWAAILLSEIDPRRRDDYMTAGLDCVQNSSDIAQSELIMFKSKFDDIQSESVDAGVQSAYEFFGASPSREYTAEYFVDKYFNIIQLDPLRKEKAQACLQEIENHTGFGLISIVDPCDYSDSLFSAGSLNENATPQEALDYLKLDASCPIGLMTDTIWNFASGAKSQGELQSLLAAAKSIAKMLKSQGKESEGEKISEVARGVEMRLWGAGRVLTSDLTSDPASVTTPPGLRNIGNTCYLNSLLQYFYNVRVVRELVLNFEDVKLGLDEESVANRRTGGNGTAVSLEEAIVAHQFVQMLQALFLELSSTTETAAKPSQKLANTALSSAKEILSKTETKVPPPLPARPSPAPPLPPKHEGDGVNVSVTPVQDHEDGASTHSSQTLVGENELPEATDPHMLVKNVEKSVEPQSADGDIAMGNTSHENEARTLTLDEKIERVSKRLEHSDRTGTSQQDVEEIIGNILEHLMRAIRPNGQALGRTDLQADKITESFFTTIVNFTVRTAEDGSKNMPNSAQEDIVNQEVVPERWITAFPHPDKSEKPSTTLYAALDRYFSYELISDGKLARYTTIRALPPILHICIQRTDASGVKNTNPVIIPETLYLDRYMEAEPGSDLWKLRRRTWAVKERINQLEERVRRDKLDVASKKSGSEMLGDVSDSQGGTGSFPAGPDPKVLEDLAPVLQKRKSDEISGQNSEGPVDFSEQTNVRCSSNDEAYEAMELLMGTLERSKNQATAELAAARECEEAIFQGLAKDKYRLHAIICHGGGMASGHYWVWIRDFQKNVWVKYNDDLVTEDSRESQEVLDILNSGSDPYYVAYVRDEHKDDLVAVPQRAGSVEAKPDTDTAGCGDTPMETIDGIEVNSGENTDSPEQ